MNQNLKKDILLLVLGIVAALTFFSMFTIKVYSESARVQFEKQARELDVVEKEYKAQLKEILTEYGCKNSGITMTKVMSEQGISYQVLIHHQSMKYLSEEEKFSLKQEVDNVFMNCDNVEMDIALVESL